MSKASPPPSLANDRTGEMLRAATELFLENGFAGVSIDAVMSRAGGSKRDLYNEFGDKEGLFRAVLARICDDIMTPLRAIPADGTTLEQALRSFARTFLTFLLTPRVIALQRLVMSEAIRYPDFAKAFVRLGPEAAYETLEQLLLQRAERDRLVMNAPRVCAAVFCDSLVSDLQFRAVAGIEVSAQDIEARVDTAVSIFLKGITPQA
ncbi:TetR/AcrR family transcriptional regulator [Pandoraea sp. ISTKB]|uniref:TetR/AcrR family transcriptional regulator n=1 Tax=Pandoraea sp. ISTKB TaxID=1586708 RepID=UPI00084771FD|nr:TetR/AcrR family transcriptional regulator [Pandoraea sp. ISTKB]ODP33217.1 transcriptional regulator [Pandoraea sp. ISTKB]